MDIEKLVGTLARVDERLEGVEDLCKTMNEKLFMGNGDSMVTRLRLVEHSVSQLKTFKYDDKRGKVAIALALATGFISMITSILVAFVGK